MPATGRFFYKQARQNSVSESTIAAQEAVQSAKMMFTKVLTLTTLLLTGALAAPAPQPVARASYTCGSNTYSSSAVNSAKNAGYELYSDGETVGSNNYPHKYNNYEGFDFPVSGTYQEWPILSSGSIYSGGSPGADRVVFNTQNQLAGVITHTGASGNNFVECT